MVVAYNIQKKHPPLIALKMGANKMSNTYRVVRLMKNHLYPTYQLHAYMANKKTAPRDGLRLAGLITMEWLRQRLGDHAPEEFCAFRSLPLI